jgi:23S rRNA (adenine2503-C2)-methyltransferase
MVKLTLTELSTDEIARELNLKTFQARQIVRWLYFKQVFDFEEMTDLSKGLRQKLVDQCEAQQLTLVDMAQSPRTGTKKALLRLADGETVESVLIRDRDRRTLCLSSQVGCPLKCDFCATGMAGWTRNLSVGEIVEQALFLLSDEDLQGRTPNIVYMGMGEPFRNYDAVVQSIRRLMDEHTLGIGARKITVSTAGDVPGMARFAHEDWQVRLSVSLHAANDNLRSKLVPLNKKYPLARLHEAITEYTARTSRQITLEWVLLEGVNDRAQDVAELAAFMKDLKATVNLIPWNPVPTMPYKPTPPQGCTAFLESLTARGITATLRIEKGQDIDAACGQLRRIHEPQA